MICCPNCQSSNIVSNQPIAAEHIDRARDFTKLGSGLSDQRIGKALGLATLAMLGVNSFFRECRCTACGARFDYRDCEHPGHG
jgi:tRNA U54 and U55 pseudouridine synthase Pus10